MCVCYDYRVKRNGVSLYKGLNVIKCCNLLYMLVYYDLKYKVIVI